MGSLHTPKKGFLLFVVGRSRERKVLDRLWARWVCPGDLGTAVGTG